jgi:hypothetical protein
VVRIIFMNETTHPSDSPHSVTGHSIGHWEGKSLVLTQEYEDPAVFKS